MKEAEAGAVEFFNFDIILWLLRTNFHTYDTFIDFCKVPESFAHKCPNNVESEDNLKRPFIKN